MHVTNVTWASLMASQITGHVTVVSTTCIVKAEHRKYSSVGSLVVWEGNPRMAVGFIGRFPYKGSFMRKTPMFERHHVMEDVGAAYHTVWSTWIVKQSNFPECRIYEELDCFMCHWSVLSLVQIMTCYLNLWLHLINHFPRNKRRWTL